MMSCCSSVLYALQQDQHSNADKDLAESISAAPIDSTQQQHQVVKHAGFEQTYNGQKSLFPEATGLYTMPYFSPELT